ncbi:hypothetical protein ACIPWF_10480 [Paenarthrobacter sp. NPDC089989]
MRTPLAEPASARHLAIHLSVLLERNIADHQSINQYLRHDRNID